MLESEQSPSANPELQDAWNMFHFSAFVALGSSVLHIGVNDQKGYEAISWSQKVLRRLGGKWPMSKSHDILIQTRIYLDLSVNQHGKGTSPFSIGNTSSKERSIFHCRVSFSEGMPQGYFLISTEQAMELSPWNQSPRDPFSSVKWSNKNAMTLTQPNGSASCTTCHGELINDF